MKRRSPKGSNREGSRLENGMSTKASDYLRELIAQTDIDAYHFGETDLLTITGVVRPWSKGAGIQISPGMKAAELEEPEWFDLPDEVILDMTVLGPVTVGKEILPLALVTIPYSIFGVADASSRGIGITAHARALGLKLKWPPKPIWKATGCEKCKFEVIVLLTAANWYFGGPSTLTALEQLLARHFGAAAVEGLEATVASRGIGAIGELVCKNLHKCS